MHLDITRTATLAARRRALISPSPQVMAAFLSAGLLFPSSLPAQAAESAVQSGAPVQLGPLRVQDEELNEQTRESTVSRMPGTIQDTPQAVNVVSQETMRQQNVTTLDQALRNVPGITVTIGEGGGGLNGDQFRIRGFDAKDDVYIDGLRDFGVYTRDSFNYESVEVLKGPSSALFGRGSTGGVINTSSKMPDLEEFYEGTAAIGNGSYYRATADANMPISETIAVRLNLMFHSQDVVSRNHVESSRWGIAPSIGFGLDTATEFTLAYLHQEDDRQPDYGVPTTLRPGDDYSQPVTEFGVPRETYYGFDKDHDDTEVDIFTGKFRTNLAEGVDLFSDSRLGVYSRDFTPTPASCNATCNTNLFDGDPATVPLVTIGGPGPYSQETWGIQNITAAVMDRMIGSLRGQFVLGFDLSYQHNNRRSFAYTPARNTLPARDLFDPYFDGPYTIGPVTNPTTAERLETEGRTYSAFATGRIWFNDQWSVVGGARIESHNVDHASTTQGGTVTAIEANSDMFNPKASLVYEPNIDTTFYLSWARSAVPQGTSIASAPTSVSTNNRDLEPEKNEIWEAGAKFNLFEGGLGVSTSIFRIEKNNAKQEDGLGDIIAQSGEKQRTFGVEIGLTGEITDGLSVTANYTYLDSEILEAYSGTPPVLNTAAIGNPVQFVPTNAASLWAAYSPLSLPDLTIGGGFTYRDAVYLNNTKSGRVPSNFSLDAVVSYEFDRFRVAVNAYNIADRLNYDSLWSNRVIPSAGRTFILSVGASL